ncbi:hypothetical protein ZIOFF_062672 [Zingiber officinale]|uniref:Uncharacterized protein n=1 Tax=Zingiber officinale TaxID=94328 RepID=A0A8J5F1E2_ZINOF|nr:hypothetical protein ZIOFF_062672 [Zingiber officinale]
MSTQSSKVGSVRKNSIGCSGSDESKGKGTLHGFVSLEPRQTTLNSAYKKDLLVDVKCRVGRFIYSAAFQFNVMNDPYWLPMVEGIAEYGRGFKPPSMEELRTWILKAEDIAKLKIFFDTIEHAKMVLKFLYGYETILSLMRKYTNCKEILRLAITHFATSFLTLQSMYKGEVMKRIVANDLNFWPHVVFCVKSVVPLLEMDYMLAWLRCCLLIVLKRTSNLTCITKLKENLELQ